MTYRTVNKLKTTKSSGEATNFSALTRELGRCHWVLVRDSIKILPRLRANWGVVTGSSLEYVFPHRHQP